MAQGDTGSALDAGQTAKNEVENNFLSLGNPQRYADKYKACDGNASCEQNIRKDMAKESAENIQKLKSCWDSGDAACVADLRSKIELSDQEYTELRQQDDMVGHAYESSAQWYADIIDQCAGKCGWLEASLLKTGADGLTNIAYGPLGTGSVLSGKLGSATVVENSGTAFGIKNSGWSSEVGSSGGKFNAEWLTYKPGSGSAVANTGAESVSLPGMTRPVRLPNPDFSPNQTVVDAMNGPQVRSMARDVRCVDCSDIAATLRNSAGDGHILEVKPSIQGNLNVYENGVLICTRN